MKPFDMIDSAGGWEPWKGCPKSRYRKSFNQPLCQVIRQGSLGMTASYCRGQPYVLIFLAMSHPWKTFLHSLTI